MNALSKKLGLSMGLASVLFATHSSISAQPALALAPCPIVHTQAFISGTGYGFRSFVFNYSSILRITSGGIRFTNQALSDTWVTEDGRVFGSPQQLQETLQFDEADTVKHYQEGYAYVTYGYTCSP